MVTVQSRIISIVICIIEVIWLLIAQTVGSTLLLLPCLACFLALIVWSAFQGMALPMLLFFLPFATILKFRPTMVSFFTVALLAIYIIYILKGIKNVSIYHLVPGFAVIALALAVKTLSGYQIDNGFILFAASLLSVPFLKRELGEKYDFYWLTIFFSLGIIVAALTSRHLTVFPTIKMYIEHQEYLGVVRYAGYYGDPNFYSSHITAALGGVFILILNNAKKNRMIFLALLSALLLYCGFLAVSKSFMLITLCLILFFAIDFVFKKGKMSSKFMVISALFVGLLFLLSSTVFIDSVNMIISRFTDVGNMSDFTTGRTDTWTQYFREFEADAVRLVFGHGITRGILVNGKAAHNVIIQAVFQMGLIGFLLLVAWFACSIKTLLAGIKIKWQHFTQVGIILLGSIGPWMGLDFLFFDEFFIIPLYACLGIVFLTEYGEGKGSVQA